MEKVKYCPTCMKEYNVDQEKCECGYEFHVVKVEDEVAQTSTNTVIIDDNVPSFVWSLISFICPIAGFILAYLWVDKWPQRKPSLMKNAIGMSIFWFFAGLIFLLLAIGVKNGDVIVDVLAD